MLRRQRAARDRLQATAIDTEALLEYDGTAPIATVQRRPSPEEEQAEARALIALELAREGQRPTSLTP